MSSARAGTQQPHEVEIISHSAAQTLRIGQRLGELLQPGDLLLLAGELGAGKTHLAKGVALGMGSTAEVTSPTFVLLHEYRAGPARGRIPLFHADLYRIEAAAEVAGIGLDDALNGEGVVMIEWPERAADWLPAEHLMVTLRHLTDTKRVIRFAPAGPRARALIETLKRSSFA
jgi:tRNA threonylcarbamoyladenosine biosynthesis protein TsaE